MKKLLWLIVCLVTMVVSANAENYDNDIYNFAKNDSVSPNIAISGKYLKRSATYEGISIGVAAVGAGLAIVASNCDNDDTKKLLNCSSIICGVSAFGIYCMHIQYKWKSGKCLELYGNTIRYTF